MRLSLIAGSANPPLAERVARVMGIQLCARTDSRFDDGELDIRIEESVRGCDVYIVQPTSPPADEHLMELLFLADACRRAGADRLTAVIPYFGYARHDRRASGRTPVGGRVVASLLEQGGFQRVVAVDLHNAAIEGFFGGAVEHLSAAPLLAAALRPSRDAVLVAPDLGAMKLAERYQAHLDLPIAVIHKARAGSSGVTVRRLVGDVAGRAPIIVDDMVTTGGTIDAAAKALLEAGCRPDITVVATHGLFVGSAAGRFDALPVQTIVSDSVVPATAPRRLQTIGLAPLLADAIARLHGSQSLRDLVAHA